MRKFAAIMDTHLGWERTGYRHYKPIHDERAIACAMNLISDFKPDDIILNGDIMDCGPASRHIRAQGNRRQIEGLRLLKDFELTRETFIKPISKLVSGRKVYKKGNHEAWVDLLVDQDPEALEGLVDDFNGLLQLPKDWELTETGKLSHLGKLWFAHGETINNRTMSGGPVLSARAAVMMYQRNIRIGHFHTLQQFTMTSAIDEQLPKTGMTCPCLCRKDPPYTGSRPNQWVQGLLLGYWDETSFHDFPVIIIRGKTTWNGKVYKA